MIDPAKTEIIFGPPGTGKTQTLLNIVNETLADDVRADKIAYLAFTRRAAQEARSRAQERFIFTDKDMPWFRTIHSMGFKQIGARAESLMHYNDYKIVAARAGLEYRGSQIETEEDVYEVGPADAIFFLDNLSRMTGLSLEEVYQQRLMANGLDWIQLYEDYKRVHDRLVTYKSAEGKRDFTDILTEFVATGVPPQVDIVIVDEAQDLSKLQWQAVEKVAAKAGRVVIAGDDDQAIYRWAGADIERFLSLEGKRTVLHQSYRVPSAVFDVAQTIIGRVPTREPKEYKPRPAPGSVSFISDDMELDAGQGDWLFLARHTHQIQQLKQICRNHGWFFQYHDTWSNNTDEAKAVIAWTNLSRGRVTTRKHAAIALRLAGIEYLADEIETDHPQDFISRSEIPEMDFSPNWMEALTKMRPRHIEYFRRARLANEKMANTDPDTGSLEPRKPRIIVSTIHGSKGAQAQGVFLLTDVSQSTYRSLREASDEHRVFYTAVTRAYEKLVVMYPSEEAHYDVPKL